MKLDQLVIDQVCEIAEAEQTYLLLNVLLKEPRCSTSIAQVVKVLRTLAQNFLA